MIKQERKSAWLFIKVLLSAAAIGFVLLLVATYFWMINPEEVLPPGKADAIVVLGGGHGERLPVGLRLAQHGRANTLVLSTGNETWTPKKARQAIQEVCAGISRFKFPIECVFALPDRTLGEAVTFSRLANERNWQSLIIVTSDYHQMRSRLWFERCFERPVYVYPAKSDMTLKKIVHEWLGIVAYLFFHRC